MIARSSLGIAALAAGLVASTSVFAATVSVDGINLPLGSSYMDTELSYEQLVTTAGQKFGGVFEVGTISGNSGISYTYGQGGEYLYGEFTGFQVVSAPPPGSDGQILLSGGQISYYVSPTNNFTNSSGQATDFTQDALGTLFLSATPEAIDAAGDTLELNVQSGTTSAFGQANAYAFLDVTGGDAYSNFNTNTVPNTFFAGAGPADINFQGTANTDNPGPDFPVSGSNDVKADVVPEPLTLSLFGAGLFGAAAMRRRKSKSAKKA